MPRPKRQIVYGLPGTTLAEVRARLQPDIQQFLRLATLGQRGASGGVIAAHEVLLALSEGRRVALLADRGWPAWAGMAVHNIVSNIRSGDYHLRGCLDCQAWMLVKKSDRVLCPSCRGSRHAKRQKALRDEEAAEQRRWRPIARVTLKSTTRTKP